VAAVALIASGGGSKAPAAASAPTSGAAGNAPFLDPKTAVATADEQKYMGRFLPDGYEEPAVSDAVNYDQVVQMANVAPTQDPKGVSLAVDDVVSNKIVYFEYQRSGDKPLPLMAYVKPSGKLFVGVSYCPPCEGQYQRIEPDGTLTCESCGTKRALESSVGLGGPCKLYPTDELPVTVNGGRR